MVPVGKLPYPKACPLQMAIFEQANKSGVIVAKKDTKAQKQDGRDTPLMRQYHKVKQQHPDAILLFRVGDFYETFGEDAVKTANILGITLTKRANGSAYEMELSGFPHHALETYLPKLIQAGQRVAVCDQLEDPKQAKNVVKRGITEIATPGTSLSDEVLANRQNNFLAAIQFGREAVGLALLDLSTGEFFTTEGKDHYIENLVKSLNPAEVLHAKGAIADFQDRFGDKHNTFMLEDWLFETGFGYDKLLRHFQTKNLKGFGIEGMDDGIAAAGVILHYLEENHHQQLSHISQITRLDQEYYLWLDKFSIRNLELLDTPQEDGTPLIEILDKTITPMGGRLLRKWLVMPLKELRAIEERQALVGYFKKHAEDRAYYQEVLNQVGDLERLISKAAMQRINPREVLQVKKGLDCVETLKNACRASDHEPLQKLAEKLNPCDHVRQKVANELKDDPPVNTSKGNLIKEGVSQELDEYRKLAYSSKDYLLELQQREINNTGITSLKVAYNNVFGYYLEVRNTHKDKVPDSWIRKQTLVNAERYITEELKTYEEKILNAEEQIDALEQKLYLDILHELRNTIEPIQQNAHLLAYLDAMQCFAQVSEDYGYVQPTLHEGRTIDIKAARHPVIEQSLRADEHYVPNDVYLDQEQQQVIILTGPNMSGKSAILRQTALCVLLAQLGADVPANEASIGLVDKIFTRVGASDNLSTGESTFMVEMTETASILNNISERSLLLLDEIGRGTATYDGISLAWAISEYLHEHPAMPKTLFATHYHELNDMAKQLTRVRNYHVSVKEHQGKMVFLRTMKPGSSEHSFGIHVARMAGIPGNVVKRAEQILKSLENQRASVQQKGHKKQTQPDPNMQLQLFQMDDPKSQQLKEALNKVDVNTLTPVEALMKLNELKAMLEDSDKNQQRSPANQ